MQQQNSAVPALLAVFAMMFTQLMRTPGVGNVLHEFVALLRSFMAIMAIGAGGYMMLQLAQAEDEPRPMLAPAAPLPAVAAPKPPVTPKVDTIDDVPMSVIAAAIAKYKAQNSGAAEADAAPDPPTLIE
jgi:hypothetical protein